MDTNGQELLAIKVHGTKGWLLVLLVACGYQWIGTGAYGGPWILIDGYGCL